MFQRLHAWWSRRGRLGKVAVVAGVLGAAVLFGADPDEPATEPTASTADEERDSEPEPEPTATEQDQGMPAIGDAAIGRTVDHLEQDAVVRDAHIEVDGDAVVIAAQVGAATSPDAARQLLDNAARFLASQVAVDNDRLDGPTADSLGELWDHYRLQVAAGADPNDPTVAGAKSTATPHITW